MLAALGQVSVLRPFTLCVSRLVLRFPFSSGWSGGVGATGWTKPSRLSRLYCRAQSQTGGSGGSDVSEEESGPSMSLQPLTGVYNWPTFCQEFKK